jgi:Flp pilus assembly protein TadG
VEATFSIVLLMLLALGIIQVALALYARNVVSASAHEGARAAIELGSSTDDVTAIARDVVRKATGALVDDLEIDVNSRQRGTELTVAVRVSGVVTNLGPLPIPIPLSSVAIATTSSRLR